MGDKRQKICSIETNEAAMSPLLQARRHLAVAIRGIIDACVRTDTDVDTLNRGAERIREQTRILRFKQRQMSSEALRSGTYDLQATPHADHNPVVGLSNPIAPPMSMSVEPSGMCGRFCLGAAYEGPPGYVHGGVISLLFDQIFGSLMLSEGIACLTGRLEVTYLAPTPLDTQLCMTAWTTRRLTRKVYCRAVLRRGDTELARACSVMVRVNTPRLRGLFIPPDPH